MIHVPCDYDLRDKEGALLACPELAKWRIEERGIQTLYVCTGHALRGLETRPKSKIRYLPLEEAPDG